MRRTVACTIALVARTVVPVTAQHVHGRVIDGAAHPLQGAFVTLQDNTGHRLAGTLTDVAGAFRVSSGRGTATELKVELIGYAVAIRPLAGDSALDAGDVILRVEPVSLPEIAAHAKSECGAPAKAGESILRVWRIVRSGLDLTAWSTFESEIGFVINEHKRFSPGVGEPRLVKSQIDTVFRRQPFQTLSVSDVQKRGLLDAQNDSAYTYWAPSVELLLSDWFAENHCYEVVETADRIGLRFRPARKSGVTDIRGVLWLSRSDKSVLDRIEYEFTGGKAGSAAPFATGFADFQRLPSGHSIISRWGITAVEFLHTPSTTLRRSEESGGEVVGVFTLPGYQRDIP